jgi:hypothetical protein
MDFDALFESLNLENEPIDADYLAYQIGSIQQSRQLNNFLRVQETANLKQEAIDRANNPGLSSFYDALNQARIDGANSIFS